MQMRLNQIMFSMTIYNDDIYFYQTFTDSIKLKDFVSSAA